MPARTWDGYSRFCPLARGLDVIGDRWTLVIVHNLLGGPARYGELKDGLPGIGSNALSDRLKKLEHAGVVERVPRSVGNGVDYALTDRGGALAPVMAEIRRWGVEELLSPEAGPEEFDHSYAMPADLQLHQTYAWVVDGSAIALTIDGHVLRVEPGMPPAPDLTVTTSLDFMRRWAAGETTWGSGLETGEVEVDGDEATWNAMLVATNYPGRPADLAQRLLGEAAGRAAGA